MERHGGELDAHGAGLVRAGDPPLVHRNRGQQVRSRRPRPRHDRRLGGLQPHVHHFALHHSYSQGRVQAHQFYPGQYYYFSIYTLSSIVFCIPSLSFHIYLVFLSLPLSHFSLSLSLSPSIYLSISLTHYLCICFFFIPHSSSFVFSFSLHHHLFVSLSLSWFLTLFLYCSASLSLSLSSLYYLSSYFHSLSFSMNTLFLSHFLFTLSHSFSRFHNTPLPQPFSFMLYIFNTPLHTGSFSLSLS